MAVLFRHGSGVDLLVQLLEDVAQSNDDEDDESAIPPSRATRLKLKKVGPSNISGCHWNLQMETDLSSHCDVMPPHLIRSTCAQWSWKNRKRHLRCVICQSRRPERGNCSSAL